MEIFRRYKNNLLFIGTQQPGCGTDPVGQCGHSMASEFMGASLDPNNVFGAIRCRDLNDIRQRNCIVSGTSRRMGGELFQGVDKSG